GRGRGGIVDLVGRRDAPSERRGREVGGGRGRGVERVVARVGARDRNPADGYRLARPYVLVGERRAGVAVGHAVARHPVVGEGDRRGCGPVVGLVHARGGDRQGPLGDVGRGRGRGAG